MNIEIAPGDAYTKDFWGIRDKSTGLFYNYSFTCNDFSAKYFSVKSSAINKLEEIIQYYLKNSKDPSVLELVKTSVDVKAGPIVNETDGFNTEAAYVKYWIRNSSPNTPQKVFDFIDSMSKKGKLDKIQYILVFKGPEDPYYGRWMAWRNKNKKDAREKFSDSIKEARQLMRNVGVKTRTFTEFRGVFGLLTDDQAFLAKLTLEVSCFFDLNTLRKQIKK